MTFALPESCPACAVDLVVLDAWRLDGGPWPGRTCTEDHRPVCTRCKEGRTERRSGLCDPCYRLPPPKKEVTAQ